MQFNVQCFIYMHLRKCNALLSKPNDRPPMHHHNGARTHCFLRCKSVSQLAMDRRRRALHCRQLFCHCDVDSVSPCGGHNRYPHYWCDRCALVGRQTNCWNSNGNNHCRDLPPIGITAGISDVHRYAYSASYSTRRMLRWRWCSARWGTVYVGWDHCTLLEWWCFVSQQTQWFLEIISKYYMWASGKPSTCLLKLGAGCSYVCCRWKKTTNKCKYVLWNLFYDCLEHFYFHWVSCWLQTQKWWLWIPQTKCLLRVTFVNTPF